MRNPFKRKKNVLKDILPYILSIGGAVGLLSSMILTAERFAVLKNPDFVPACNISPLVSCTSVSNTPYADVLGFPDTLIGVAAFSVLITIGVALLAGARFKRWFWVGLQLGVTAGIVGMHAFFLTSVYLIGALCIYCMIVWAVTLPIFWYVTLYNLREKHITTPKSMRKFVSFIQKYHGDILFVWYAIIVGLIVNQFWDYWVSLL